MKKIAFVTNLRAPYRTLQLNEFSEIYNIKINAYYTNKPKDNRSWNIDQSNKFNEFNLKGIKISGTYGYLNYGLYKLVQKNDLIILGGYEQPSMLVISFLCKILKKPYIIFFDGISKNRLNDKNKGIKGIIKKCIVKNSSYVMANGKIGELYFRTVFNYDKQKIFNQYLSVDIKSINKLFEDRALYRKVFREKLGIEKNEKVLLYSGRAINIKNIDFVIKAISQLKRQDITFVIIGGGELEDELVQLAGKLGVKFKITGFINKQIELFKHYFLADIMILPSKIEAWGLVINEAMASGLPVLVSEECGASLDLVSDNGYTFNPYNQEDFLRKLEILLNEELENKSNRSREIIKEWTFENSKENLKTIIKEIYE